MRKAFAVAGSLALAATGVMADDKVAVEAFNAKFMAAANKGDAQALANLYDQNATVLPDKAPLMEGRDKIAAYWREGVKVISDLKLSTVSVQSLGPDTVQEVGTMTYTVKMPGAQATQGSSKYLTILRKEGDDLKIITDMWNDNK
jgi:uncharacterized protein (TIGR02246 family)